MKTFKVIIVIGTHGHESIIQAQMTTGDTNGKKLIEAINDPENNGQYYYYIEELKEIK